MKVLFLDTIYNITLIPKIKITETDVIYVNLRNEFTKTTTYLVDFTFEIDGNYLKIMLNSLPNGTKHKDKFEFNVNLGQESVYIGKILVLNNGTNVQNYANDRARFQ